MRKLGRNTIGMIVTASLVFGAVTISSDATADTAAVEVALLGSINAGRAAIGKPPLVMHAGLREQQQAHAMRMSEIAALTHDGYAQRAQNATPDPAEADGAPDDGFSGSIAENVAQNNRAGRSDADLAESIYQQWLNSPGHKANMFDESSAGYNAAGVGIFEEAGGKVWAALLLAVDGTAPDGTTITPSPSPTPKKKCKRHRQRRCRRR
jgi:uncharacterized protein YkwD